MQKIITGISLLLILTGCSSLTSPARDHKIHDNLIWVDFAADRRGAWIVFDNTSSVASAPSAAPVTKDSTPSRATGSIRICAEPFPDAADNVNGTAKHPKSSIEFGGSQTKIELSGRSSSVLALRESLYRICELNMMGALNNDQTHDLFKQALTSLESIANTEVATSPAASVIQDYKSAHQHETAGFDALLADNFDEARTEFEQSEQAYPSFRGSYEFSRVLRNNKAKSNKDKAKALLEIREAAYLPTKVRVHLESLK